MLTNKMFGLLAMYVPNRGNVKQVMNYQGDIKRLVTAILRGEQAKYREYGDEYYTALSVQPGSGMHVYIYESERAYLRDKKRLQGQPGYFFNF